MKLDKELERYVRAAYLTALPVEHIGEHNWLEEAEPIEKTDWIIPAIKTVILEALKAEMPKRKKSVENMGNEMGGSFIGDDYNELYRAEDFGYNQAIDDCLEVCNKLLGDRDE